MDDAFFDVSGSECVVGREVSEQPPWSIAMSTMTDRPLPAHLARDQFRCRGPRHKHGTDQEVGCRRTCLLDRIRGGITAWSRATTLLRRPRRLNTKGPAADLVIGAVLIPVKRAAAGSPGDGEAAPTGLVPVDIAIDQGGCFETSRPTTHRPDLRR